MFEKEVLLLTIVVLIVTLLWKNYRLLYLAYKIPYSHFDYSLKGIWGILNADNETIFKFIAHHNDGPLMKTWLGPILMITVSSPEDVKIVFNAKECLSKPNFLLKYTNIKNGTLFGDIDVWRSHRKILNPCFGIQQLRNLIPLFNEKTKILLKILRKMEGKDEFDVFNYMTAASLETFLKVLELDVDIQNEEETKRDSYSKNFKEWSSFIVLRLMKPWFYFDFMYRLTNNYERETEAKSNSAMLFSSQAIENVNKNIKNQNNNKSENDEKSKNFVRVLMNPENNLTESEIFDEISTLILAAQDTSALVTSSVLLLLAMHKDIQEKVHEELIRVIEKPSNDFYVDFDHVNELEYLEMVINEAMRVIPVVPFVFRINDKEIKSHEGYIIPAKTILYIPVCNIHKNKLYWGEDADEFKPERFSKENFSKIHPYAFIPFTKGQRICIGWRYAMILIKIQLANILLNYKVDTKLKLDELRFQAAITMNIIQGHQISIEKRQN